MHVMESHFISPEACPGLISSVSWTLTEVAEKIHESHNTSLQRGFSVSECCDVFFYSGRDQTQPC